MVMLNRTEIHGIIRAALDLPETYTIPEDVPPSDIPEWDSIGWMNIIVMVEEKTEKEIPLDLFDDTEIVKDFCDVILSFTGSLEQ
jgi:acyl carrier protein